jgi:3-methyladenine DNA glycosylase AlkD
MAAAADPERAVAMQAYMKSTMPYHGLSAPRVDAICKRIFAEHPFSSCVEYVHEHEARLSGLSRREALKNIS